MAQRPNLSASPSFSAHLCILLLKLSHSSHCVDPRIGFICRHDPRIRLVEALQRVLHALRLPARGHCALEAAAVVGPGRRPVRRRQLRAPEHILALRGEAGGASVATLVRHRDGGESRTRRAQCSRIVGQLISQTAGCGCRRERECECCSLACSARVLILWSRFRQACEAEGKERERRSARLRRRTAAAAASLVPLFAHSPIDKWR